MNQTKLSAGRVRQILVGARKSRVLVVGDVMLDHFIWGSVARISPEAPVPVVDFERESLMPGGAANVARNLTSLEVPTELLGAVGRDPAANQLKRLLKDYHIGCQGLHGNARRSTTVKTRIVAHTQQVVRIDRETRDGMNAALTQRLGKAVQAMIRGAAAVIVGSSVILFDPIFQGLAISLMAGEIASLLLSRMAVPILYYLSRKGEPAFRG